MTKGNGNVFWQIGADLLYIQNASTGLKCCAKWYARRILYRCKFASCVSKPLLTWLEFCAALQKAIVVSEPCLVSRLIWCSCNIEGQTLSHLPWENLNLMLKRPSFVNQNDNQSLFRKKSFPIFSTPPCFLIVPTANPKVFPWPLCFVVSYETLFCCLPKLKNYGLFFFGGQLCVTLTLLIHLGNFSQSRGLWISHSYQMANKELRPFNAYLRWGVPVGLRGCYRQAKSPQQQWIRLDGFCSSVWHRIAAWWVTKWRGL